MAKSAKKVILALFLLIFLSNAIIEPADLIVFSYDRPMQLYALLESCDLYLTGLTSTTVIYRVSSLAYQAGYDLVKSDFANVNFVKQQNPPHDFKNLVQKYAFEQTNSAYIMFAVDDLFIKSPIDIIKCIDCLERFNAYTLSLRLSPDINYCYSMNKAMVVPPSRQVAVDVYQHSIKDGQYDWAYPNSVDMNLYRKSEILKVLLAINFDGPNRLEGTWASYANLNQTELYFSESKIVNIPLNLVQNVTPNLAMHSYTTQELLMRFMQGQKINLEPISKFKNHSVHADFDISFIPR